MSLNYCSFVFVEKKSYRSTCQTIHWSSEHYLVFDALTSIICLPICKVQRCTTKVAQHAQGTDSTVCMSTCEYVSRHVFSYRQ